MSGSSLTTCAGGRNPGSVVVRRGAVTGGGYSRVTCDDTSYGSWICDALIVPDAVRVRGAAAGAGWRWVSGTATWVLPAWSNPVAITVIRTSSVTLGSIT